MINKDFFLALEDLEREKGISQQAFIDALENALVFAYKKHTGDSSLIQVKLNPEKKSKNIQCQARGGRGDGGGQGDFFERRAGAEEIL